jgi:hypothetical protein
VRGGWVKLRRLTLLYNYSEGGYGNETWSRDFASNLEAQHAKQAMQDRECAVHYNPEREGETTLLWSEVKAILDRDPYVPRLVRLGRVGYRWLVGLAAAAVAGLSASLTLYGVAMSGSSACVCEAVTVLLMASPMVLIVSLIPLSRAGMPQSWKFVLKGWKGVAMAVVLVGVAVSLAHFGPAFRALPRNAEVPDKVFAGVAGALAVPVYLLAAIFAVEGLQRLRPVEERVGIPTAV